MPTAGRVDATAFSAAGGALTGTNVDATGEAGEPGGSPALNSAWFTWTPGSNTRVVIHTCGSAHDTVLGVYTGSAVNALTTVAANDDDSSAFCETDQSSLVIFSAVAGTTYRIQVDGFGPNTGTFALTVDPGNATTRPNPLDFGTQPLGTVSAARTVRFLNASGASLTVNQVSVPGDYFVTDDPCSGAALASGLRCTVSVRFAPEAAGARPRTLTFSTSLGNFGSTLTGTGGALPQGPPGTTGTNGAPGAAGPVGPAGPQGPPGRDARVTCRPLKGKGRAKRIKVTCKVAFVSASRASVRAVLLRGRRVVATGSARVRRGRVSVPLLRDRRLARGRYDLLLTFTRNGQRVTIEQRVRIR